AVAASSTTPLAASTPMKRSGQRLRRLAEGALTLKITTLQELGSVRKITREAVHYARGRSSYECAFLPQQLEDQLDEAPRVGRGRRPRYSRLRALRRLAGPLGRAALAPLPLRWCHR